jgi:hypothetical protein
MAIFGLDGSLMDRPVQRALLICIVLTLALLAAEAPYWIG